MSLSSTSIRALGIWYKKLGQPVAISFTYEGYMRRAAGGDDVPCGLHKTVLQKTAEYVEAMRAVSRKVRSDLAS
jgi:hypothetical protein